MPSPSPDASDTPPSTTSFTRRVLIAAGIVTLLVIVLLLVRTAANVLLLAFAGVLFAAFLNGLARQLRKYTHLPYGGALAIVSLIFFALMVGAGWLAGPHLADQLGELTDRIPSALESLQEQLRQSPWGERLLANTPDPQELMSSSNTNILGNIAGAFSTVLGGLANVLIILVIGLYLAVDPPLYTHSIRHLVPPARRERAHEVMHAIGRAMRRWLTGRIASMTVVGVLTTIGLWILGVPLAPTLGLIAALLSFVPNLGPILSVVPALLVALMESTQLALYLIVLYIAVQTVESYLITPLIQQRAVSIPPALLLTVQILMGVLFGVLGLLLATPLAVVTIVMVQMLYVEDVLGDDVKVMGEH